MAELLEQGLDTATAWRLKERLRWIRLAKTPRAARWRIITRFITCATELIGDSALLESVRKALATLSTHAERVSSDAGQQGAVKANSRPAAIPNLRHFYLNIPYASLDGAHWQIAVTHYCPATVRETVTGMLLQQLDLQGLSDQFTCSRSQQLCQRGDNVFFWL